MACYLLKTEPSAYSYEDLLRDKRAVWDGITNAAALIHLRKVKKGDRLVIYHTGGVKAAVGLARATSDARPDPKLSDPKRAVVDLAPERAFPAPVPLAAFRADSVLRTSELVRFTRLSVMPLTDAQFARVLELAGA